MTRPGEQRLREALARRRKRHPARPPISVQPTTALEALLLERMTDLEKAIETLETRVNWLLVTIVGACLVFIIETLLTP